MIVSMIVGMLRIVSDFTEEPEEILTEVNRRLCGQTYGGFATCLVVRLEAGGGVAMANAGHLPPYWNGLEFPFAGSVPLGLVETAAYEQASLEMRAGDRVVLMTDGVAEARNAGLELFGFSRVEELMREGTSVKGVADLAQEFGQEDDLTVIGVVREV
jgi:serine phosphatase RsbU (regulator of sigma subunit)